jgi:hypothetical protein
MIRQQRPRGFTAGIAIGTAIALVGFLFGVAVASIPSSSGVISACYSTKTGALRVIDAPSKHCVSGERALSWSKSGPAPAVPAVGDLSCSPTPVITGTLYTDVDPVTGVVTLRCFTTLKVSSNVLLSQIFLQASSDPNAHHDCSNTKVCSFALPPGTTDADALVYASVPFHITCPGAAIQGSFFDATHTINVGRCQNVKMTSSKTVIISAP